MSEAWLVNRAVPLHQFYKTTREDATKAWELVLEYSPNLTGKPLIQYASYSVFKSLRQSLGAHTDLLQAHTQYNIPKVKHWVQ